MKLRVKGKDGKVVNVDKILCIKTASDSVEVAANDSIITFQDNRESYADWYASFINKKEIAMYGGGDVSDDIKFKKGIGVYIEEGYLKSITGCTPDANGNIQLLPGLTVDVLPFSARVSIEQIKIPTESMMSTILEDINRCVWYLYHAYNTFLYRMNIWKPNTLCRPMFNEARLLGLVPSYQAAVAAWNIKVWRRSFLWDISPIRETISFSIGYMALDCVNPSVSCKVILTNTRPVNDTTKFLTIYDQGISTNLSQGSVNSSIKKITKDSTINLIGTGSDSASAEGIDWEKITIEIDLGRLNQGEYYKASFSLAVAQNEKTAFYYQKVDDRTHHIDIETIWSVDNTKEYGFTQVANIPALLLYEDIGEEDDYIK